MRPLTRRAFVGLATVGTVAASRAFGEQNGDRRPRVTYAEGKEGAYVSIDVPFIEGARADIWCYEDRLGRPTDHRSEGQTLVLTHRLNEATVVSRFEPVDDAVAVRVEVSGPDAASVKAVRSLNPCWQLRRSPAFANRGDYVEDFVARCFVFLESGFTLLRDTKRVPGTCPPSERQANLPKPWIQEYYPIWRKHPGQTPGQRGRSPDRPVYPLVGCVSRDGKHLTAFAWPECQSLGQVWHDCLHPRPAIGESYDAKANRTVSRGRLYFMANDPAALLAAFRRDFPDWRRPLAAGR